MNKRILKMTFTPFIQARRGGKRRGEKEKEKRRRRRRAILTSINLARLIGVPSVTRRGKEGKKEGTRDRNAEAPAESRPSELF